MKKGNILIIGLICIANAGVIINASNFSKKENAIEIKEKQKQNNTTYFELYPTGYNATAATDNESETLLYRTRKNEWQGQNSAMLFKGESITQSSYEKQGNNIVFHINETPSTRTTILNKWQITPYLNLNNVNETTKLSMSTRLQFTGESGAPLEQLEGTLKLKITTYTTTQDWSNYLNQANYYIRENNNTIIETIENTENTQNYSKKEEIKDITITKTVIGTIEINQEIEVIKTQENKTNYIFTYIQPYMENLDLLNYVGNGHGDTSWAYIYEGGQNPIKISGTMIPPITDYEVIDIPGLMFNILTMPFSFISTAFNLTLFPGTPYQINLSNLILTVMAIFIFVFIIKKIFIK